MRKVEETQEYIDTKALEDRVFKLSNEGQLQFIRNLISRACWEGPVNREWLESEVESQEKTEIPKQKFVVDHPIEDHFGSEIQTGDKWFQDQAGRIVLEDNADDYLIEVAGVNFFRAIE